MTTTRPARAHDADPLLALALRCQLDPRRMCAYLGDTAAELADDLAGLEPLGPSDTDTDITDTDITDTNDTDVTTGDPGWVGRTTVLVDHEHRIRGWVLADTDDEIGRVWWWGPFVDPDLDDAHATSAAVDLVTAARAGLAALRPSIGEEEIAVDERATSLVDAAIRLGMSIEEGSDVLVLSPDRLVGAPTGRTDDLRIAAIAADYADVVAALHDATFPGSHLPGPRLVTPADDRRCWVAVRPDPTGGPDLVAGYIAVELQSDGSWYVDFLGVAPTARGAGVGRRLVHHAAARGAADGATRLHLTVRAGNAAARSLYRSLGFESERVLVPARRGFAPVDDPTGSTSTS